MKKYNKYFVGAMLAGAMTLSLTSCDLEEYNPGGETADEVFQTAEGMEYLVNQMYYNFRWKYYGREDPALFPHPLLYHLPSDARKPTEVHLQI